MGKRAARPPAHGDEATDPGCCGLPALVLGIPVSSRVGSRNVQVVAKAGETNGETYEGCSQGHCSAVEVEVQGHGGDRCADQCRHGVETTREYGWHAADDDVTDGAAADASDGAEDGGLQRSEVVSEGFGGAGDGGEAEPRGGDQVDQMPQ